MRVGRAQAARLKPDSTTRPSSPRRISDAATRHSAFTESHGERHASAQQKYGRVCARDDRARVGARRGARTCCGCFVVLGWSFLRASVCCTFQIGHKFHAPGLWVQTRARRCADTWLTSAVTHLVPLAPNATPPKPLGWYSKSAGHHGRIISGRVLALARPGQGCEAPLGPMVCLGGV